MERWRVIGDEGARVERSVRGDEHHGFRAAQNDASRELCHGVDRGLYLGEGCAADLRHHDGWVRSDAPENDGAVVSHYHSFHSESTGSVRSRPGLIAGHCLPG